MNQIDIDEAVAVQGTFDLLVFCYDGKQREDDKTGKLFIIRNTNAVDSIPIMSEMEECEFMINGAVQLSMEQTHHNDTAIMAPTCFLVTDDGGGWYCLHEVEVWDSDKYLEAATEGADDGRDFTPPYEP